MTLPEALSLNDVLLKPKYSTIKSRSEVDLSVDLGKNIKLKMPIVPSNMKNIVSIELAKVILKFGGLVLLHRFQTNKEQLQQFLELTKDPINFNYVGISVGCKESDKELVQEAVDLGCKIICVDIAHANSINGTLITEYIAKKYPEILLIVGTICTSDAVQRLKECGADIIRVNLGNGSICSTRIQTGNGYPQFSALQECYDITKIHNVKLIGDGGMIKSGDLVKALCLSHLVMTGNIFAGTSETPGKIIKTSDNKEWKTYQGSSTHKTNYVEGYVGKVPFKGSAENIITSLLEGIRSGCSYQNSHNLTELRTDPIFMKITQAGQIESGAHDLHHVE